MGFIDPDRRPVTPQGYRVIFGAANGARRLWLMLGRWPAGHGPSLHRHEGDEGFRIVSGEVLFVVGDEQRVCRAGDMAFVPPDEYHAFVPLTDCEMEVMGEREMGEHVLVLAPDGTRREVEIFTRDHIFRRPPPPGQQETPEAERQELFETTRHLIRQPA